MGLPQTGQTGSSSAGTVIFSAAPSDRAGALSGPISQPWARTMARMLS